MAEQEQSQSVRPETSNEPTSEPTLEQVYKQFNVEETASEFRHEPQRQEPATTQPQVAPPSLGTEIPDAVLDQQGFKSWLATQQMDTRKALGSLHQTQQRIAAAEFRRQEESDIKGVVAQFKEIVGDIDDDVAEITLGLKAKKDPRFAKIWGERHQNPARLKAAVRAVGNEFKGKYQFRQDSQLTENVRAARQSTQTSLTSRNDASDNPMEKSLAEAKTPAEFERRWAQIMNGG